MKTFLTLFIFIISSNIFAMQDQEAELGENIKPLRIGFFIGNSKESFCDGGGAAITYDFACAISQRALDVAIVSDYVLKNLILRKYTKVIDPVLEKNRNDFDHILEKIDFDLSDRDFYHVQDTQFFVLVPRDYDNPVFNKTKWTKIDIPSNSEYNGVGNDSFPVIPWIGNTPSTVKRLLSDVNLNHIPYAKNLGAKIIDSKLAVVPQHKFEPKQIAWFFNTIEDYENLSQSQPFNIFMSGHGTYTKSAGKVTSSIAGMSSEDMASTLLFFNDKINTKSVRISTCEAGGKNLDLIQIKKDLVDKTKTIPIRMKYLLIIDSITDAPTTSDWKTEDTTNANLRGYFDELEKFQIGYKDFTDKLVIIKAKISALNSDIEQKIEEIGATEKEMAKAKNKAELEKKIARLRAEIEEIKSVEIEKLKSERNALDESNGFMIVLSKITLPKLWYFRPLGANSYPQVWLPEIGWFQSFTYDPFIQKITDRNILKNSAKPIPEEVEIETKKAGIRKKITKLKYLDFDSSKTMNIKGKYALLLYSEITFANIEISPIGANLDLNKIPRWLVDLYRYFPSIPCVNSVCKGVKIGKTGFYIYPQIISMQHGNSLNMFSRITLPSAGAPTTQNGILNFLRDSFLILRDRNTSKTFFIKELQGFNDFSEILHEKDEFKKFLDGNNQNNKEITLQNILISTERKGALKKDKTFIVLSFEFMGKPWFLNCSSVYLNPKDPVPHTSKEQFLWKFKESKTGEHEKNLNSMGLTHMAKLSPINYYTQLPTVRRLFKNQTTKSLKEFIIDLTPENIIDAMKESPVITEDKWIQFEKQENQSELLQKLKAQTLLELNLEQQFRLQMNLNRLKTSLIKLKQKLESLGLRLGQLKEHLSSMI